MLRGCFDRLADFDHSADSIHLAQLWVNYQDSTDQSQPSHPWLPNSLEHQPILNVVPSQPNPF